MLPLRETKMNKTCVVGVLSDGKLLKPYVKINSTEWIGKPCKSVDQAFLVANNKLVELNKE